MKCPQCDTRLVEEEGTHCPNCGWVLGDPLDLDLGVDVVAP